MSDTVYEYAFIGKFKNEDRLEYCAVKKDNDTYYIENLTENKTEWKLTNDYRKITVSGDVEVLIGYECEEKSKVNEKVNIKDFIPKIYKISIPIEANPEDNRKSYAFYTSTKIQAIYENTMINQEKIDSIIDIVAKKFYNSCNKHNKKLFLVPYLMTAFPDSQEGDKILIKKVIK